MAQPATYAAWCRAALLAISATGMRTLAAVLTVPLALQLLVTSPTRLVPG